MNSIYAVCLITVIIHLIGIPAFVWAVKNRQFGRSDQEAYRALEGDASLPRVKRSSLDIAPDPPPSRMRMALFFGLFIVMFAFVLWSLAIVVIASAHTPGAQTAP